MTVLVKSSLRTLDLLELLAKSKNGLLLSIVELNSKVAFFVPNPPDRVKKGTVIKFKTCN